MYPEFNNTFTRSTFIIEGYKLSQMKGFKNMFEKLSICKEAFGLSWLILSYLGLVDWMFPQRSIDVYIKIRTQYFSLKLVNINAKIQMLAVYEFQVRRSLISDSTVSHKLCILNICYKIATTKVV